VKKKEVEEAGGKELPQEIKLSDNPVVGMEVKAGDKPAEDGDYEATDGSTVTIKDGKIESIKPKEGFVSVSKIDNPFLSDEKKEAPVDIKDFNDAINFMSTKTGIEIKDIKDIPKFVTAFTALQTEKEELTGERNQLLDYKAVFDGMPEDILSIFTSWLNEEDYHGQIQTIARMSIDFTKPVDSHESKTLVDLYFPNKFSAEDYEEMKEDKNLEKGFNIALESARKAYKSDQEKIKGVRDNYKKQVDDEKKAFTKSVEASLETLQKSVPYLQENHKKKVKSVLDGGVYGIMEMFVDRDGSLKPEAAKLVALALYGEQAINAQSKIAANRAETQANETILRRTSTKEEKKIQGGGKSPGGSESEQAQEFAKTVIPRSPAQENPFAKPFFGDRK